MLVIIYGEGFSLRGKFFSEAPHQQGSSASLQFQYNEIEEKITYKRDVIWGAAEVPRWCQIFRRI